MTVVLDTNMIMFANRLNITSSRMVRDYGLKTVDEIIEAEAAQGNTEAVNYARKMYNTPAKLIKIFRLTDVDNKFVIINNMDSRTREMILPMLQKDDLVMGLYFFTQEKLLQMLTHVDIAELVNVAREAFALPEIVMMFKEKDLAQFFQSDKLEKYDVIDQLKCMPYDVMEKFVEGITGRPMGETNPLELIKSIDALPTDKYRDFMSSIDPDVQRQLVFQLAKEEPKYLQLFENQAYVDMLETLMKAEMVKPMIALEKETMINMIAELPDELMSIVGAQVDTKKFAEFLIDGHLELLNKALMV